MTITLYEAPMSSATPVVHALMELDIPWERVTLTLDKNDQKKPEFLRMNPNGKVPTLVVDGTPMFEALAIMTYLGERFGVERQLWPAADDPARMEAMSWSTWAYVSYGSAIYRLLQAESERLPKELHNPAQVRRAREDLTQLLTILNERLAGRDHIVGKHFSLADVIVASVVIWGTYCNIPITDYPNVSAWTARFQARPSFQKVWAQTAG
jgi:glutathione S-transferase